MKIGQTYRFRYGLLIVEIKDKGDDFNKINTWNVTVIESTDFLKGRILNLLETSLSDLFELVQ